MPIVKEIYSSPSLKEDVKLASETAEEEAELELQMLLKEFEEWKKENKGGFKDFLKSEKEVRTIKLKNGGSAEEYKQSKLSKRVEELMDDGYDFGAAVKEAMKEGL
tara:strand:- start:9603 stop:9920 length:318 start_codon:yes stop_codon:yes gene_type:complete